jgi:NADH pyrophosphatase NudC (nudix superfamily)
LANNYAFCPYDGSPLVMVNPEQDQAGRFYCTRCGFVDYANPHPCVAFFVLDVGRVLIGRRAVEPAKEMWDILGGFIDPGESAEAAVLREAKEETNLEVKIVAYLGSVPDTYGNRQSPTLNLVYLVRPESGHVKAQSDVAELQWFTIDTIPTELAFPHQQDAVRMLREYLSKHEL